MTKVRTYRIKCLMCGLASVSKYRRVQALEMCHRYNKKLTQCRFVIEEVCNET